MRPARTTEYIVLVGQEALTNPPLPASWRATDGH